MMKKSQMKNVEKQSSVIYENFYEIMHEKKMI